MGFFKRLFNRQAPARRRAIGAENPAHAHFFKAIEAGEIFTVRLVLSMEPQAVRWTDEGLNTGLAWALHYGRSDIANLLQIHGASMNATNAAGVTPRDYAAAAAWAASSAPSAPSQGAAPLTASAYDDKGQGRFATDDKGFLLTANGQDIAVFADQKSAARWALSTGHKMSAQTFEVANHPTRSGCYVLRDRAAPPSGRPAPASKGR